MFRCCMHVLITSKPVSLTQQYHTIEFTIYVFTYTTPLPITLGMHRPGNWLYWAYLHIIILVLSVVISFTVNEVPVNSVFTVFT